MREWIKRASLFYLFLSFSICIIFTNQASAQQDSSSVEKIAISTNVNRTSVPLNRTLELKVTISWLGDSDRYTVVNFDNPALTNFEIVGTSTINRSELIANQKHVFKDFVYTLKPKELGMGYVEGVLVKAHNNILDKDENLMTQRIPVEVVDPLPEPGKTNINWIIVIALFIVLAVGTVIFFWLRRKKRLQQQVVEEPKLPTETAFLNELREEIQLDNANLKDDFTKLSRLLRRYLTEKFDIRALEITTDELAQKLNETEMEENHINSIKEILIRSDEIKFSGMEGSQEELTRFYTITEGILETYYRKSDLVIEDEQK